MAVHGNMHPYSLGIPKRLSGWTLIVLFIDKDRNPWILENNKLKTSRFSDEASKFCQ